MNICILGPASSGKTTAAAALARSIKANVVESDELAHEAYATGTAGWHAIHDHFGSAILASDQTIDRGKLGEIIFQIPAERDFLRSVVDPFVRERVRQEFVDPQFDSVTVQHGVLVSYLMIERKWFPDAFHHALVISSGRDVCIERMKAVKGHSSEYANAVLNAQLSNEEIIAEARRVFGTRVTVIFNNGDLAAFEQAIRDFLHSLLAFSTTEDQTRWAEYLENESSHLLSIFIAEQLRASWFMAIGGVLLGIMLANKPPAPISIVSTFTLSISFLALGVLFSLFSCYPVDGYKHVYRDLFGVKYRRMCQLPLDEFLKVQARPGAWSVADYLLRVQYHYRSHWLIAFRRKRLMAWATLLILMGVVFAAVHLIKSFM